MIYYPKFNISIYYYIELWVFKRISMKILLKILLYILLCLCYMLLITNIIESDISILNIIIFSIIFIAIYFLVLIPFIDSMIAYFSKGERKNDNKKSKRST